MQDIKEMLSGREETAFAFSVEDRYIVIQEVTGGYDYSVKDTDYNEIDGGLYDDPDVDIAEALSIIVGEILAQPDFSLTKGSIRESSILEEIEYDEFLERAGSFKV